MFFSYREKVGCNSLENRILKGVSIYVFTTLGPRSLDPFHKVSQLIKELIMINIILL